MPTPSLVDLKAAYDRNENITRVLRDADGLATNTPSAIEIAYDLQAGSYVRALDDPAYREVHERYAEALAAVLTPLQPTCVLEAGVGEATTLRSVLPRLGLAPGAGVFGFDLSWSRIHVARRHCEQGGVAANLFLGEMGAIPLPDGAVDVVFTSHAIEPNRGREAELLSELFRVTGRYLALFEPGYELASPESRARMDSHAYCRGLRDIAGRLGKVMDYRLLPVTTNPLNPTAVLLIEKSTTAAAKASAFVCPSCRGRCSRR